MKNMQEMTERNQNPQANQFATAMPGGMGMPPMGVMPNPMQFMTGMPPMGGMGMMGPMGAAPFGNPYATNMPMMGGMMGPGPMGVGPMGGMGGA